MKRNLLSILALGLGFTSMAQYNITDITDITLTTSTTREVLAIDIDGDGTNDFTAFALDTTVSTASAKAIGLDILGTNKVVGAVSTFGTGEILNADALNAGVSIDNSLSFVNGSSSSNLFFGGSGLYIYSGFLNDGNFNAVTDKFIGVEFMISGATHYGWIQVSTTADAGSLTIKAYGYNQTAGTAITAGAGVSVNENELANVKAFYANNQLNINGIEGNFNVSVIDLLGKSISNENVNGNTSINLNTINNGIYLVKITKGNAIVTKKVYIK